MDTSTTATQKTATDGRYERAGWRIASFAAERLEYAEKSAVTTTTLWVEYLEWCRTSAEQPLEPISKEEFFIAIEHIALKAGFGRRQNGGHVLYDGVAFQPTKVAP